MGGMKQIVYALPLFALLVVLVIFFGINLAKVNQSSQSIADDPAIGEYADNLNSTLAQFSEDGRAVYAAVNETRFTISTSLLIVDVVQGVWKIMLSVPVMIYNLTIGLVLTKLFGVQVSQLFAGVLGALVSLAIFFALLALWSRASPDG